jgi:hypothetical protein
MASPARVKQYIASWLQLGRKIYIEDSKDAIALSPKKIVEGDRYSQEFESVWQQIAGLDSHKAYLEGTNETIAQLIAHSWEIVPCSVCNMLVATPQVGTKESACPCHDIPDWPNNNVPIPNGAIDSQSALQQICDRLTVKHLGARE